MAQILFFADGHRYEVNGRETPSVSEITRFLPREIYQDINQYRLDEAAARGTSVHRATEALDKYGDVEVAEAVEPYIRAYIDFRREHKCEWSGIERVTYHAGLDYAGTIDRIGLLDGQYAMVDIKAQDDVKKKAPAIAAQLGGYMLSETAANPRETALFCLQLTSKGKYRLYPVITDGGLFMACYALHTAFKAKQPKGRIEF